MKFSSSLIIAFLFTGCATPDMWTQQQHQKQMMVCRTMCGEGEVEKYEPYTGTCKCRPTK